MGCVYRATPGRGGNARDAADARAQSGHVTWRACSQVANREGNVISATSRGKFMSNVNLSLSLPTFLQMVYQSPKCSYCN